MAVIERLMKAWYVVAAYETFSKPEKWVSVHHQPVDCARAILEADGYDSNLGDDDAIAW